MCRVSSTSAAWHSTPARPERSSSLVPWLLGAVNAARHGQHRAAQAFGVGHGVQRAAADASLGHTKHLRQAGNQPVAGQKGALLHPVAGRVLAADGAAAFLDALAQLDVAAG